MNFKSGLFENRPDILFRAVNHAQFPSELWHVQVLRAELQPQYGLPGLEQYPLQVFLFLSSVLQKCESVRPQIAFISTFPIGFIPL